MRGLGRTAGTVLLLLLAGGVLPPPLADVFGQAAVAQPRVFPLFGGRASPREVRRLVGEINYSINPCPEPSYLRGTDEREVIVSIERVPPGGLEAYRGLVDALLYNGAAYAWRTCPLPYIDIFRERTGGYHYDVWSVLVTGRYGPLVSAQLSGQGLSRYGDQTFGPSSVGYQWSRFRDLAAEHRLIENQTRQRQEAAAARAEQQRRRGRDPGLAVVTGFFSRIFFFVFLGLLVWAFVRREEIAIWFHSLTPHPATNLVEAAIHSGAQIDASLYHIVADQTAGWVSNAEQQVRARQANALTAKLRTHERALRAESERRLEIERRRIERENAFARAHVELMKAGVSHEEAAARLSELKRMTGHG